MKNAIHIAVVGALGKVGKLLVSEIKKKKCLQLVAKIIKNNPSNNLKKKTFNQLNNTDTDQILYSCLKKAIQEKKIDIVIDFSNPESTIQQLKICKEFKKNIVIGTTGFNINQIKMIQEYSKKIGIVLSSNFSIGINLVCDLLKKTALILGHNSDIEIIESHHREKKDSPSGTAIHLGNVICDTLKWNLEKSAIYRKKEITPIRKKKQIGFSIIRAGNIIGEHKIIFINEFESVEIKHTAFNRTPFAEGAIRAAQWLLFKKNGLFNMNHVINETF
ncbi:4-hydroxy-tetrahydrodipicolinate reductase [Buchnera aphidicola (Thelaxes californica)]|uniref:4-hydroxy-tetrahydrodipicolinate reductase n=1 Tax=Buchnera aphidicola (Thelaxes californica) TaxID=1315998 RepID=A0A4D6YLW6_9GAMM|nr:4-hydroxy-tetrahydrodipicolinate reductase [Buchnera aphidicola]QCI26668.1 4-hydroxy-tetrahydrodipicolinate reductase [Buchnera aphidicola (Thelaxes californica)]